MKYVMGWLRLRPGQREAFMVRVRPFVALSRTEPGVQVFEVNSSDSDAEMTVWTEIYDSEQVHAVHQATPEHQALLTYIRTVAVGGRFIAITPQSVKTDEFSF